MTISKPLILFWIPSTSIHPSVYIDVSVYITYLHECIYTHFLSCNKNNETISKLLDLSCIPSKCIHPSAYIHVSVYIHASTSVYLHIHLLSAAVSPSADLLLSSSLPSTYIRPSVYIHTSVYTHVPTSTTRTYIYIHLLFCAISATLSSPMRCLQLVGSFK